MEINSFQNTQFSVIILAGGYSSRFNSDNEIKIDKALVDIEGITLIDRVLNVFEKHVQENIIVLRREQQELQEILKQKENRKIVYDNEGLEPSPLRGVIAGLEACSNPYSFLSGCDYPNIQTALLNEMISRLNNEDIVISKWQDYIQPLPCLIKVKALNAVKESFLNGEHSLFKTFSGLIHSIISEARCKEIDPKGLSWLNINDMKAVGDYSKSGKQE